VIDTAIWVVLGSVYGMIIGVIPIAGVTTALITVFAFAGEFMSQPYLGLAFVTAIVASCAAADSYTSILTGIPGASTTAACIIDGYPMSQQGEAGRAMGIAIMDSLVHGVFWGLAAFLLLPMYGKIILWFGIPEMLAFMILALACVGFVVSRSWWRSCLALALGVFIGLVGQSPATGADRFTFGWDYLAAGIQMIPVISGLFGVPELVSGLRQRGTAVPVITNYWQQLRQGFHDCWRCWRDTARGGVIGFVTGLIPGVGGAVGDFLAYGATVARHPGEKFGNGNPRGLLGCEGANSAQKVSSMIPTVLFGVPAAPFAAMVMALCMYFGIELGSPALITNQDFTQALLWGFVGGTVMVAVLSVVMMRGIVMLLSVPYWIYAAVIGAIIVWANLQYTGMWPDLAILAVFSAIGMACRHWQISRPAILVAYVIAERLENYGQQTFTLYSTTDLITRPGFMIIVILALGIMAWSLTRKQKGIEYA
jgi:putative tricarboxylic transport membrane protein